MTATVNTQRPVNYGTMEAGHSYRVEDIEQPFTGVFLGRSGPRMDVMRFKVDGRSDSIRDIDTGQPDTNPTVYRSTERYDCQKLNPDQMVNFSFSGPLSEDYGSVASRS